MMQFGLGLLLGGMIGCAIGVVVVSMCVVAKKSDEGMETEDKQ